MFRLFRPLNRGEFIVVFGDTAQGGEDDNFGIFGSKTRGDVPLVMQKRGMATQMTPFYRDALRWIYKQTGIKPVVCLERNNGGSSAMFDLASANIEGDYIVYYMVGPDGTRTDKQGWLTDEWSRAKMLGEYVAAYNAKLLRHYDQASLEQHQTFITNRNGRPEAAPNTHDDAVIASAGCWQLMQTEVPSKVIVQEPEPPAYSFTVN
jgi:hypothetical protein